VLWDDVEVEVERRRCDFERRLAEGRGELVERMEKLQRSLREGEEARRREWEELNGRLMTAEEKRQVELDYIQMMFARMTDEFVQAIRAAGEDTSRQFAETRAESRLKFEELLAESRAQRQATLRMLDRLPPPEAR
jgi:hypothetical protein